MTNEDYIKKIDLLVKYNLAYYINDEPIATDEEWDKLSNELKDYEKKNPKNKLHTSPTDLIGGVASKFLKLKHKNKMWSQEDLFSIEDVEKWFNKIEDYNIDFGFMCYPKYDGLSLKLIYNHGVLLHAITRGNGTIGEDVTNNARVIPSIPNNIDINTYVEISGEITIKTKDFNILTKERKDKGLPELANARNSASGSMRLLDSSEVSKRRLTFYPWEIHTDYTTLKECDTLMESLGFEMYPLVKHCKTLKDILNFYDEMVSKRDTLPVGLDGMIIKVNNKKKHSEIGYTGKYPKWSCAFKFPPIEKVITIKEVINQVGRTGTITPVAVFEPILIDGTMVEKATLHNYKEIAVKDYMLNDQCVLIKSGDIIPKLIKVFKDRRTGDEIKIKIPTICPTCNTILENNNGMIKCVNPDCMSKIIKRIEFFVGRDYMNIVGMGPKLIAKLVEHNLLRTPVDIFKLSKDKLTLVDGLGDKVIDKLLASIEVSKTVSLDRFISSLGIHSFGRTISKELCSKYEFNIFKTPRNELLNNKGIGDETVDSFLDYVTKNKDYIDELMNIISPYVLEVNIGKYTGKHFVLTGSMGKGGKQVIEDYIKKLGGVIKSSVGRNTYRVVYGENPGNKLDKAKELGIATLHYKLLELQVGDTGETNSK